MWLLLKIINWCWCSTAAAAAKNKPKLLEDEGEPIEENINRIMIDGDHAQTIDEAINLLRLFLSTISLRLSVKFLFWDLFLTT